MNCLTVVLTMRRPPNISISQWFRQNALWDQIWVGRAPCSQRQDLPWIADRKPTLEEFASMAVICGQCPVMRDCAHYAVATNNGRGVDGGYYAGAWLPWVSHAESGEVKLMRTRARRDLRLRAGIPGRRSAGLR